MPTRQDQLHSYQFMLQRVVAAIVLRDTDPPQSPFRRAAGATLAGILVATLGLAAAAVLGVLSPTGGTGWQDGRSVVVERESGARYVYRDGRLHPVMNYASALLIIGSESPRTVLVSRRAIAGVPRGVPLGIAGAPDSLPPAAQLIGVPWTLCSRPAATAVRAESLLFIGPDAGGGEPIRTGRPLGGAALLTRHPDGSVHLIWQNHRHLLRDPGIVLPALGWGNEPAILTAPALFHALPAAADLARIPIADRGKRSTRVPDAKIGEVFVVESQGGGKQYAVAVRDGLAGLTQVQADLLIGDPLTVSLVGRTAARPLSQGEYALIPKVGPLLPSTAEQSAVGQAELARTPELIRPSGGGVCALIRDPGGVAEVRVEVAVPDAPDSARTGARTDAGTVLADRVVVSPGRGAVVEAMPSARAQSGTLSVVSDLGVRHDVASTEVLAMLGFGGVRPLRLPSALIAMIPGGRALDPEAARTGTP